MPDRPGPYDWQREGCFETGVYEYDTGDECSCDDCMSEDLHERAHLAWSPPEDGDGEEVSLDNAVWLWREKLELYGVEDMIERLAQEAMLYITTRD
jgi:hypothetical protein